MIKTLRNYLEVHQIYQFVDNQNILLNKSVYMFHRKETFHSTVIYQKKRNNHIITLMELTKKST